MTNKHDELYAKYMAFHNIMLEEYTPLEIAAIISVQGLSFYRTILEEDDYNEIVDNLSDKRNQIKTFDGPEIL